MTEPKSTEGKATRFRLGKEGPLVSASPELAAFLQGKGDSPVKYAESAPPTEGARVQDGESPVTKTSDLTVTRDRAPSVKRQRRTDS